MLSEIYLEKKSGSVGDIGGFDVRVYNVHTYVI